MIGFQRGWSRLFDVFGQSGKGKAGKMIGTACHWLNRAKSSGGQCKELSIYEQQEECIVTPGRFVSI
jgi:hypothetical protein